MKTRVKNIVHVCLVLFVCAGFTSCNKDDFYEKEYLENPDKSPESTGTVDNGSQGGVDAGSDGSTQGGVDAGVSGGTEGGATTGSSTGGADGSTTGGSDGSTTGGTDGSTTGGTTTGGTTTGGTDGSTTGGTDGSTTGGTDGSTTGGTTTGGTTTGGTDGSTTGGTDGSTTGGTTGGTAYDCNNGHGNDDDGVDESNPGVGGGGPNAEKEAWISENCQADQFQQASQKKLDIMWIIDNSGSMADEQDALAYNFDAFINEFIDTNVDFKMAITTTDTSSFDKKGRMVTGSDVKLTSAKAQQNPAQFKADFSNLVRVGTSGSGYEKGLAASEGFMEKYAASFLRPDAYLAVVVLTDEEDQSAKTPVEYVNFMKSFKQHSGLVKVYSICDVNKTNPASYGITQGCERYAAASEASAGVVSDIRNDFHQVLSAMGDSIINLLDSFALSQTPVDGSIKVEVNGVEMNEYTYDASTRSIKFNPGHVPAMGSAIEVSYQKQ